MDGQREITIKCMRQLNGTSTGSNASVTVETWTHQVAPLLSKTPAEAEAKGKAKKDRHPALQEIVSNGSIKDPVPEARNVLLSMISNERALAKEKEKVKEKAREDRGHRHLNDQLLKRHLRCPEESLRLAKQISPPAANY